MAIHMAFSLPDFRRFPPLELVTILAIIVVLVIIVTTRLPGISASAERRSFETTLQQLQNAVDIRAGTLLISDKEQAVLDMVGSNPFRFLSEAGYGAPANYLGELDGPENSDVSGYRWYFDRSRRHLVYRVYNRGYIEITNPEKNAEIEFKLSLKYADRNLNDGFNKGIDAVEGLELTPVRPYRWLDQPGANQ